MRLTYQHSMLSGYLCFVTQAITVNLPPLLFVTFQQQYGISLDKIALLISLNFGIQIGIDFVASRCLDRLGFRVPGCIALVLAGVGLMAMGFLPNVMNPYAGLVIATVVMAVSGGMIEVIASPMIEALPNKEKAASMSLMHSFYCWGQAAVVLLSTLFFVTIGRAHWRILPFLWAIVPLFDALLIMKTPLIDHLVDEAHRTPVRQLFRQKLFWVFFLLMLASGASEQAMSQWASMFAELGLNISKTMGDLLGPCMFACLMGVGRLFFGIRGARIDLHKFILYSSVLGVMSYMLSVFARESVWALIGCSLTGLSVAILWPGTLSLASRACPTGGAGMFAILALAGDVGCSIGPGLVGTVSTWVENASGSFLSGFVSWQNMEQLGLKTGLFCAVVFPVIILVLLPALLRRKKT